MTLQDYSKNGFNMKILVAEDDLVNRKVAEKVLQRAGIDFDIVEDGEEAVRAYLNNRYDMILMDVHMPRKDGYEATQEIREHQKSGSREVKIVAMTASVMEEDMQSCLDAGMDDFLSKPINIEALKAKIAEYSGVSRAH